MVVVFEMMFVDDLTSVDVNGGALKVQFFMFEPVDEEVLDSLGGVGLIGVFEVVKRSFGVGLRLFGYSVIALRMVRGCQLNGEGVTLWRQVIAVFSLRRLLRHVEIKLSEFYNL